MVPDKRRSIQRWEEYWYYLFSFRNGSGQRWSRSGRLCRLQNLSHGPQLSFLLPVSILGPRCLLWSLLIFDSLKMSSLLEAFGFPRPLDRQGPNSEDKTKLILKTLQEDVHRFEVAPFKILSCFWWVHSFPRFCKFDITQFDGNYSSLVFEDKTYPLSRGCLFLLQYRRWNARPLLDQRKRSGSKRLYAGRQLAHSGW